MRPTDRARRERREAERRLESGYGWPDQETRRRIRLTWLGAVLAVAAGAIAVTGWHPLVWTGLPGWWVPLVLVVAAALLAFAGRMRG